MLRIEDLTFPFPDFTGRYSLTAPAGAIIGLAGPSGGGKTTLLDGIAGFLTPVSGMLSFEGIDLLPLPPAERPTGMIFQDFNLFPDLTAIENIGLGIRPSLRLSASERNRAAEALASVELAGFENRKPGAMSGGERQRVALARALAGGRHLLLFDEAFSGLDPGLRQAMLRLVAQLARAHGLTVLMSIHTPEDLIGIADSVAFIAEGHIAFHGPVERFFASSDQPAIRRYLGERAFRA
jgi:thiamine transport system ATP-binding protein